MTPTHYKGKVWCVRVPSGAFVARRNGKVFVTGNSGFPKSANVGKAIDKHGGVSVAWFGPWFRKWREENGVTQKQVAALFPSKTGGLTGCVANWELGFNMPTPDQFNLIRDTFGLPFASVEEAEREVVAERTMTQGGGSSLQIRMGERREVVANITAPATAAAKQWQGWGTALKPAMEPITVARKPLIGTVAENVQKFGTGAINIDGCRVELRGEKSTSESRRKSTFGGKTGVLAAESNAAGKINRRGRSDVYAADHGGSKGRWPANLILTYPEDQRGPDGNLSPNPGKDEVVGLFPNVGKAGKHGGGQGGFNSHGGHNCYGKGDESFDASGGYADSGSAARFFYCAKASRRERDEGCEGLPEVLTMRYSEKAQGPLPQQTPSKPVPQRNHHPTVKPLALMRYLCRLVTPPGGSVLDPFAGSGTTGMACSAEGMSFIGMELEAAYYEIAKARIKGFAAKVAAKAVPKGRRPSH